MLVLFNMARAFYCDRHGNYAIGCWYQTSIEVLNVTQLQGFSMQIVI